jgi:cytidylate kinase
MVKVIITIGRQFGSGGREVGRKVASSLGIPFYDKELLAIAAKESGLSAQFLEDYDEKPTNSLLYSIVVGQSHMLMHGNGRISVEQMASKAQRDAVMSVASKGSCVIVGRCADYILREEPGLVRVFLSASKEDRIRRICERDGMTEDKARDKMRRMDKARRSYYSFHADGDWGEAYNYDICINVSRFGIDKTVETILQYVKA